MEEDDTQFKYFSEALKARGIDLEPWKLEGFAEKKELGQSEAEIIRHADAGRGTFKVRHLAKGLLAGTAIGAVATTAVDYVRSGGSSWAEVRKRSPKTATVGGVIGATAGWAASIMQDRVTKDALEDRWAEFKRTTHEMELAWTEALAKRAAEKELSVHQEDGQGR
jgi:hypothetical protein